MNGSNLLVDTNFLIYLLNGRHAVKAYLRNSLFISEVTEMELLGVKNLSVETLKVRSELIWNCYLINFNSEIKRIAIQIKQNHTFKLPDAIIAASIYMGLPLLTGDKRFKRIQGRGLQFFN